MSQTPSKTWPSITPDAVQPAVCPACQSTALVIFHPARYFWQAKDGHWTQAPTVRDTIVSCEQCGYELVGKELQTVPNL